MRTKNIRTPSQQSTEKQLGFELVCLGITNRCLYLWITNPLQ